MAAQGTEARAMRLDLCSPKAAFIMVQQRSLRWDVHISGSAQMGPFACVKKISGYLIRILSCSFKNVHFGDFLVVQWLRIRLPMQGTQVVSLGWEDPIVMGQVNPCATTSEPTL